MTIRSWAMLTALFLAMMPPPNSDAQRPGISGRPAPSWQVDTWYSLPEGIETLDVDAFRGKVLYVYCFQSWCPGCHSHGFPTLQTVSRHFADAEDVAFVAIQTVFEGYASNTVPDGQRAMDDYDLSIPWAQTEGQDHQPPPFMRDYRTGGTPWVILIDPQGIVRFDGFGIEPAQAIKAINSLRRHPDEPAGD